VAARQPMGNTGDAGPLTRVSRAEAVEMKRQLSLFTHPIQKESGGGHFHLD